MNSAKRYVGTVHLHSTCVDISWGKNIKQKRKEGIVKSRRLDIMCKRENTVCTAKEKIFCGKRKYDLE